MPKEQLLLTVPAYGHSYCVPLVDDVASDDTLGTSDSFDPHSLTRGDALDDPGGVDFVVRRWVLGNIDVLETSEGWLFE
jgi:hypothetical protein